MFFSLCTHHSKQIIAMRHGNSEVNRAVFERSFVESLKERPSFSAKTSATLKPTLCLVFKYLSPIFPRPTITFM